MTYSDVLNQLLDMPSPFIRSGFVFAGLIAAFAAALARNTRAIDAISNVTNLQSQLSLSGQTDFSIAQWGWLNTNGQLWGVPRNLNETDPQYRSRIYGTINAAHVTPQAIVNFIKLCFGLNTSIEENFLAPSYQINFVDFPNSALLAKIAEAIVWVRPAGIPFLPLFIIKGGLFLTTCNYYGAKKVTGSYFGNPTISVSVVLSPYTNSPTALLPTIYLTNPALIGQLVNV